MVERRWGVLFIPLLCMAGQLAYSQAQSINCYNNSTDYIDDNTSESFSTTCLNMCKYCVLPQPHSVVESFEDYARTQSYSALCEQPVNLSGILQNFTNQNRIVALCLSNQWSRYPLPLNKLSQILVLDRNRIKSLEEIGNATNQTSHHTQVLSIQSNGLQNISNNFFKGFFHLQVLVLRYNSLTFLNWTTGLTDSPLISLDLSHNMIATLNNFSFGNLRSLLRLDLSHNLITYIETNSFYKLSSLSHMDLSSNHLISGSIFKNAFSGLRNLTFLSLAKNQKLSRLPLFDFVGLEESKLESLDLHKLTMVTSIDAFTFYGLQYLKKLNLTSCSLNDLTRGWLNGGPEKSLEVLDLSCNRFRSIKPDYFVSIDENTSRMFCPPFKFYKTKYENERYIVINNSPDYYRNLESLNWLSLKENFQLRELNNNAFSFVPKLNYLFLQRCNITILNIASIKFLFKDGGFQQTVPLLKGLWVFDNPLHCDCRIRSLIRESALSTGIQPSYNCTELENQQNLNQTFKFLVDSKAYLYEDRCHTVDRAELAYCFPFSNLRGYVLDSVPKSYLYCAEEPMVLFIAMIIGPLIFVATIAFMLLCGFLTVTLRRLNRRTDYYDFYQNLYRNWDQGQRRSSIKKLLTSTSSISTYGASSFRTASNSRRLQRHFQSASPNVSQRKQFRTNMALGGFNSTIKRVNTLPLSRPFREGFNTRSSFRGKDTSVVNSSSSDYTSRNRSSTEKSDMLSPTCNPREECSNLSVFEESTSEEHSPAPSTSMDTGPEPLKQRKKKIRFIDDVLDDDNDDASPAYEETRFINSDSDPEDKFLTGVLTYI